MFDPLDFYSPDNTEQESFLDSSESSFAQSSSSSSDFVSEKSVPLASNVAESSINRDIGPGSEKDMSSEPEFEQETDSEGPLYFLDLPHVSAKPPDYILVLVLKLFQSETFYNFNKSREPGSGSDYFSSRNVSESELDKAIEWFQEHFYVKLKSRSALSQFYELKHRHSDDFFKYITAIVASDLHWIPVANRESIYKMAGLRLAENCGRTAQPEIVRNIIFESSDSDSFMVKLKEPSLTSDNLGLKTWGSSLILAQRLLNNYESASPEQFLGGNVLELGSGTGLVGIMCCKLAQLSKVNVNKIFLTDLPEIVGNLAHNVELNGVKDQCRVLSLDWTDPTSFDTELQLKNTNVFDTVILSDPIYSNNHPDWICDMIKRYWSFSKDARLLIQLPLREKYENEREKLWRILREDEKLNVLKEVKKEVEDGYDDFGKMKFLFTTYQVGPSGFEK